MGKREDNNKKKVCLLHKIRDKKNVLFGAFSKVIIKEDKHKAWTNMAEYGYSTGNNNNSHGTQLDNKSLQWFGASLASSGENGVVV
ncbi:hypothetical protein WDU94_012294, partial [Cyamophila willieti]